MNPCCQATLASLRTASEVAAELNITRNTVHTAARRLNVGTRVNSRVTVFTPEDVDVIRLRTPA